MATKTKRVITRKHVLYVNGTPLERVDVKIEMTQEVLEMWESAGGPKVAIPGFKSVNIEFTVREHQHVYDHGRLHYHGRLHSIRDFLREQMAGSKHDWKLRLDLRPEERVARRLMGEAVDAFKFLPTKVEEHIDIHGSGDRVVTISGDVDSMEVGDGEGADRSAGGGVPVGFP